MQLLLNKVDATLAQLVQLQSDFNEIRSEIVALQVLTQAQAPTQAVVQAQADAQMQAQADAQALAQADAQALAQAEAQAQAQAWREVSALEVDAVEMTKRTVARAATPATVTPTPPLRSFSRPSPASSPPRPKPRGSTQIEAVAAAYSAT